MITKKSILLIGPTSKTVGGKATFTRILIDVFNDNSIRYYHIDLIRAKSSNQYIRIIQHPYNFVVYKIKLVILLATKPIDVVQIHTSSYFDFYDLSIFIIVSKLFRKNIIVRHGGGGFPSFYNNSFWINKVYLKWILSLVDKLVVLSEYWSQYYRGLGVKEDRLFLMPNFVNELQFHIPGKSHNNSNIHVLYMPGGSLVNKGFHDIRNSINKLAKLHSDIIFHIVGSDVDKYLNGKNIKTYKEVKGEQKISLFNSCHILLLPSRVEGFPNTLIEAMASEMAVITTRIPQIACLADDGHEYILIDPVSGSQLEKVFNSLINDKEAIRHIGKNARRLVERKYSRKLMPEYLRELYNG